MKYIILFSLMLSGCSTVRLDYAKGCEESMFSMLHSPRSDFKNLVQTVCSARAEDYANRK